MCECAKALLVYDQFRMNGVNNWFVIAGADCRVSNLFYYLYKEPVE